jgi:hypothetical protein
MLKVWILGAMTMTAIAVFAGCGDPTDPEHLVVSLDRSFILNVGETASLEGENLDVTLVRLVHDNRCPANADCIWPGLAQIELKVISGATRMTTRKFDLLAGADSIALDMFSDTVLGYNVRFEQFEPYPGTTMKSQTPPVPPGPRAQLRISRKLLYPRIDGYVSIVDIDPPLLQLDPITIESAWTFGDTLFANTTVGGGCERHYYFLEMSPAAFAGSDPAEANIYLRHFANFDICEGAVASTLRFDISAIRRLYEQTHEQFAPIQLNLFDYFDDTPGASRRVRYGPSLMPGGIGHYWIYEVTDRREPHAPTAVYLDTIAIVGSGYSHGKLWWQLEGREPEWLLGFSAFSYRADTVVVNENCEGTTWEARRFVPLTSGSYSYRGSSCSSSRRYDADQFADTTIYEWCRNCSDANLVWKVVPGVGVVSGSGITFTGDIKWQLVESGEDLHRRGRE